MAADLKKEREVATSRLQEGTFPSLQVKGGVRGMEQLTFVIAVIGVLILLLDQGTTFLSKLKLFIVTYDDLMKTIQKRKDQFKRKKDARHRRK